MREDEIPELEKLMSECWLGPIKGGVENEYGKVNILLQSYISKSAVDSFSLVSDMSYIAQVSISLFQCEELVSLLIACAFSLVFFRLTMVFRIILSNFSIFYMFPLLICFKFSLKSFHLSVFIFLENYYLSIIFCSIF